MVLSKIKESPEDFKELTIEGYCIYGIQNIINDKWYVGMTSTTLKDRLFSTWGGHLGNYERGIKSHLYNSMRKYGLENFKLHVLTRDQSYTEVQFIEKYDSYLKGYNSTKNGLGIHGGNSSGTVWVHRDGREFQLDPRKLGNSVTIGRLCKPRKGKRVVTDGVSEKVIPSGNLEEFLSENKGWRLGRGHLGRGTKTWVTDGTNCRQVKHEDLSDFLSSNRDWKSGFISATLGHVHVKYRFGRTTIPRDDLEKFLIENPEAEVSHTNSGRVSVTDGVKDRNIPSDELPMFLELNPDYRLGRTNNPTTGKVWVTNDSIRKYINSGELDDFLQKNKDFRRGFRMKPS